jgi:hypothetical protein
MNTSPISRIRRNHGLEHATLHILAQRHPKAGMAGHSDTGGFWIIADVPIEEIYDSVEGALARLRAGEENLAIHSNCGTNFATAGILAGLAGGLAMLGVGARTRDKIERLPLAILMATAALILAQPLGFLLQERVTTSGRPGNLRVVEIVASQRSRFKAYRVGTRG